MERRNLPVILPMRIGSNEPFSGRDLLFTPGAAFVLLASLAASILLTPAVAQGAVQAQRGILETLWKWTPLLFWGPSGEIGGFVLNVLVSCLAMAIGTALGLGLGLAQVSPSRLLRYLAWWITQIFRNSPWLVLLFYFMLLLPFQIRFFGLRRPASRMVQGDLRPIASGHGEHLRNCAGRD